MIITIIFIVGIVVSFVVGIVVYSVGGFNRPNPDAVLKNPNSYKNIYTPLSPWGWPKYTSSGTIKKDEFGNELWDSYAFVEGSTCGIYTAQSVGRFIPGFPTLQTISEGVEYTRVDATSGVCINDDQIMARKAKHMCRGELNLTVRSSGVCRGNDGNEYQKGEIEEFWVDCDPKSSSQKPVDNLIATGSSRCKGGLGILAFNVNTSVLGEDMFSNSRCISSPETYPVDAPDGAITIDSEYCDMRPLDEYNLSRQLFRIERADYSDKTGFTYSPSGKFLRIVHRKTGKCLAPNLSLVDGVYDIKSPINGPIMLISPNYSAVINNKRISYLGYWWGLLPAGKQPNCPPYTGSQTCYRTNQYIVYVWDPNEVLKIKDETTLWDFIMTNPFIMRPEFTGPKMVSSPIIKYNEYNPGNDKTLSDGSKAQYYDYSIIQLLININQKFLEFNV